MLYIGILDLLTDLNIFSRAHPYACKTPANFYTIAMTNNIQNLPSVKRADFIAYYETSAVDYYMKVSRFWT
jgi:hypothetical protein